MLDRAREHREGLLGGLELRVEADGVHGAKARIPGGVDLPVQILLGADRVDLAGVALGVVLAHHARVGEVVGARHAVAEEVEAAVQSEPVDVVGVGSRDEGALLADPAVEAVTRGHAAHAAREDVAVRRDEPRRHEGPVHVEHLATLPGGRCALPHRRDPAVVTHPQPAAEPVLASRHRPVGHREDHGIDHGELCHAAILAC
jgi:hypothetical protein